MGFSLTAGTAGVAPDRRNEGRRASDGGLEIDRSKGTYHFHYATTLEHLIYNEFNNANITPDPGIFYRLTNPARITSKKPVLKHFGSMPRRCNCLIPAATSRPPALKSHRPSTMEELSSKLGFDAAQAINTLRELDGVLAKFEKTVGGTGKGLDLFNKHAGKTVGALKQIKSNADRAFASLDKLTRARAVATGSPVAGDTGTSSVPLGSRCGARTSGQCEGQIRRDPSHRPNRS